MSMLSMILVGVAVMAVVAVVVAVLGVVRGGAAIRGGSESARAWVDARGGTFEPGTFGAWSATGPHWKIRARATSAGGRPRLEGGLNTRYTRTDAQPKGLLYAGPKETDVVDAVASLLGAPRPLETVPTGDAAFDASWVVAVGGADVSILTEAARQALRGIPPERRAEVLVHEEGIEVIIVGTATDPLHLDALAGVADGIALP